MSLSIPRESRVIRHTVLPQVERVSAKHWKTQNPQGLVSLFLNLGYMKLETEHDGELARLWKPCGGSCIILYSGYFRATSAALDMADTLPRVGGAA